MRFGDDRVKRGTEQRCVHFIDGSFSSTLTCTSTGSPATTVAWLKDGQPLSIDGSTYQLTQAVANRAESTYENVLTIDDKLANIIDRSRSARC